LWFGAKKLGACAVIDLDVAALTSRFDSEQSHLRTALRASNRKIFNIESGVVVLAHGGRGVYLSTTAIQIMIAIVSVPPTTDASAQ
jgi:hypothetical protein